MLSAPSSNTRGVCRGLVAENLSSVPGSSKFAGDCSSGGFFVASARRAGTSKIALIVFALLIWSVLTREVSMVPGCWLARRWWRKLSGFVRFANAIVGIQYWLPMIEERFSHLG